MADRAKQSLRSAYAIGADPTLSDETTDGFIRGFFLLFSHAVVLRDETTRTVMRYVCVIIAEDDQGEP